MVCTFLLISISPMRFSISAVGPRRNEEERGGALGSTLESRHAPTDRRAADWRCWTRVNYFDRLLIIAPVYSSRKPLAVLRPSPVVLVPSEISPIRQLVLV